MIQARRGAAAEPRLRRAALATALVFATNGFLLGSWVSRLPATRDRLGASVAELGLVLLGPGFGSLLSMPFSGRWCRRFGSRLVVAATTVAACTALVAVAKCPCRHFSHASISVASKRSSQRVWPGNSSVS